MKKKVIPKKNEKNANLEAVANMLFEAGMLAQTPRSWTGFLGSGNQSVAEHLNRVSVIAYALGSLAKEAGESVDMGKILSMAIFHDFAEARTSDLNYVHQKYATVDEEKAVHEFTASLPFGKEIEGLLHAYEIRDTLEAKIVKDADNLEFILSLKEQSDSGNTRALSWIPSSVERLKTPFAQAVVKVILKTPSDDWWFKNKNDEWWIHRNHKKAE